MSVFSNQRVIDFINQHFIPVATDINRSQHRRDAEGDYFRKIAEQGHYAGRTKPTPTRQGLYVATAAGDLLASVNSTRADEVLKMMKQAVAKWQQREAMGMLSRSKIADQFEVDRNYNVPFPTGGMILSGICRDLPRADDPDFQNWRHNFDNVWLTAKEVAQFKPLQPVQGFKYSIDDALAKRLARFHFVDHVNGESESWSKDHVKLASLGAEVIAVNSNLIKIRVSGKAKCIKPPTGERNPYTGLRIKQAQGVAVRIVGYLIYDSTADAFKSFDLVAIGPRWGTATYNFRHQDMGPEPIGFAFRMLEHKPENMTEPKFLLYRYFD